MAALENFRENLQRRCKRRGLSQRELARRSGVHYVTINRIFKGEMEPTIPLAERLAEAVDTSLEKILVEPS